MVVRIALSLFLTGIVLGAGPCAVSCGPPLASYIWGASRNTRASMVLYAVFVVARLFVYSLIGLGIGAWGEAAVSRHLGGEATASALVLFGFLGVYLGVREWRAVPAPGVCACGSRTDRGMDVKAALLFGLAVALAPCAPLLGMLGYIALVSDAWWKGVFFMVSFGLGTAISPVILLCAGAGRCVVWAEQRPGWARVIRRGGAFLLALWGSWTLYKGLEVFV